MSSKKGYGVLGACGLWMLGWSVTYVVLGHILVNRGFIAFVWPAYELVVSVFHAEPSGVGVRIAVGIFLGLIWMPLPFGVVRRRPELVAIPLCILVANWFSALLWGHARVANL